MANGWSLPELKIVVGFWKSHSPIDDLILFKSFKTKHEQDV